MCSHQETKCCSTSCTCPKEKPPTETCAPSAGEESTGTNPSRLAELTELYSGYATELRAHLQAVLEDLLRLQKLDSQSRQQGLFKDDGSAEILNLCLKKLLNASASATASGVAAQLLVDLAGRQKTSDSSCQCARMKGKSLG